MKFYEVGELNKPVIILLPGTCCHWKANFEKVIPFLAQDFRVVCVSYDDFDETEKSVFYGNVFHDMVTEKIENYIKENCGGKMLEVPVGTGILSMPVYETMPDADIT